MEGKKLTVKEKISLIENLQDLFFRELSREVDNFGAFGDGAHGYLEAIYRCSAILDRLGRMEPKKVESEDNVKPEAETPAKPDTNPDEPSESDLKRMKEETREKLASASNAHPDLNIPEIMGSLGYHRLSEVPYQKYKELLARVDEAIASGNAQEGV